MGREFSSTSEQASGESGWDKVAKNIELRKDMYVGTADVSRMRQALVARREDLKRN